MTLQPQHKKQITNLVIVGGGTSGWLTASWFAKFHKGYNITVIESPNIPNIGVGESVTPHVTSFLLDLGVDINHWMKETGSVYKFANKFVNWVENKGEKEYFGFNYTRPESFILKDISEHISVDCLKNTNYSLRDIDYLEKLIKTGKLEKFDRYFNPHYWYMENNTMPFMDEYLLNQPFSFSQHIDANKTGDYLKKFIALPNGVRHLEKEVSNVVINSEGEIDSLIFDTGQKITADFFIDCTGFKGLLTTELEWNKKLFANNPIDSAWVGPSKYIDRSLELKNYTQSIALKEGWQFKIGLYSRMGNGYCFSDSFSKVDKVKNDFEFITDYQVEDCRLLRWEPYRLKKFLGKNCAAIGLSCGFIEPLEANALYIVTTTIRHLSKYLSEDKYSEQDYNKNVAYLIDDIADFILVHYTLSQRHDSEFWNEMKEIGKRENHTELVASKIDSDKNSIQSAFEGKTLFPDYMWMQFALSWDVGRKQTKDLDTKKIALFEDYFKYKERKHRLISSFCKPTDYFYDSNIFNK